MNEAQVPGDVRVRPVLPGRGGRAFEGVDAERDRARLLGEREPDLDVDVALARALGEVEVHVHRFEDVQREDEPVA